MIIKIQQQVFNFLKDIGHGTVLAVAADLMPFSNDSFDNARFMSQLLFLADGMEDEYIPITFKEWKEAKLSRYAVEKARYYFYTLGVLDYCVKKDGQGNPVVHYKLNFKALMTELKKFFKDAKNTIFSSFADSFKRKSEQTHNNMRTSTNLQYKETYKSENIGQQIKKETKEEHKARMDSFYL